MTLITQISAESKRKKYELQGCLPGKGKCNNTISDFFDLSLRRYKKLCQEIRKL